MRLSAVDATDAASRFEELRSKIKELSLSGHRGSRFLFNFQATSSPPLRIEWSRAAHASVGGSATCTVAISLLVVGQDEAQARARFDRFRSWLKALAERGYVGLELLAGSGFESADGLTFQGELPIDPGSMLFRGSAIASWFDSEDVGALFDEVVVEVFRHDLMQRFWVKTDEVVEAVRSLELAFELLQRVEDAPYQWKWEIITLHGALQAYMVLALKGSDSVRVLKDEHAREVMEAWDTDPTAVFNSRYQIDSFPKLYKKVKSMEWMGQYVQSKPLVATGTMGRSIRMLNRLSNLFVHFSPSFFGTRFSTFLSWSSIASLPSVSLRLNLGMFVSSKKGTSRRLGGSWRS